MSDHIQRLSKSQYLRGLQCPKALWLHRHRLDLAPPITEQKQWLFDSGHEVGRLAQAFFEDGLLIDEPYRATDRAIDATNHAIADGREVIYEATACSPDGAFSRIDILKKDGPVHRWDLIEVKQSTAVKDYHIDDIALQRYAFAEAGYDVQRSILMHLDRDYVRRGGIDPHQLFLLEDCTDLAVSRMAAVPGLLANLLQVANQSDEPTAPIGRHCRSPFECDFVGYCWQHVPAYSVFNVFGGDKLDSLLAMNILDVRNLPPALPLTDRQSIDVQAHVSGKMHIDRGAVAGFLNALEYPLYYLDYETIFPAIPLFDRSSPYQQIPFQFSLHTQQRPGSEVAHEEFLHIDGDDPREDFIRALVESCGSRGSVIVYNMAFEARINRELAARFPRHAAALEAINTRMIDLLVPFRSRYLYHPAMQGSASIKKVLPAFVPELRYDDLAIGDGDTASRQYLKCIKNMVTEDEKQTIYADLKRYCAMDTWAEVRLIERLREII
ncbi:hypothetical protein DSCW_32420 [Desulfosarcina widdelii]|uniref:DUF2779 domain-containing protein n=1 Tax=Desulfosarcina widdelii TaxID=947919 RepID=A0A5K7Z529_9BACT|nr:DUF2779 domain-containing protein [Desulfosarcina widdelii]BBO75825.1 hypothetical protein DSCW_32420 [Desulfosarcina widdelii]